jgi:hypothetical protein
MDPNYYASVDIYPRDLLRAKRLVCNETECQAEIVQPIAFGANLPILNSLLIIRYQRSTNLASGQNHHEAYIGGRYSPVSIGKILKVSFDFGWDINNAPKTAESGANGHPWITKFDCGVSAYCHTPLLSFGVIIGRKGLHFDSYANGGLSRSIGPYVNVTPALPPDLLSVEYKDLKLPPWLRRVIDQVKDGPSVDPDIAWSAWAERI